MDKDVDVEEKGQGFYRDVRTYVPRLAQFYLILDLQLINCYVLMMQSFKNLMLRPLFFYLLDEAPLSGTTFLLSFVNVGRRICSNYDNFLIFGGNVKENGEVVRWYIKKLHDDIRSLESKVFEVNVDGNSIKGEFRLELVPNDMKMMCFISGELSNAAFYFSSFANVTKENCYDFSCRFNGNHNKDWQPFPHQKRLEDVKHVVKKKHQISFKCLKQETMRNNITSFIQTLESRQEFVPPQYINAGKAEPLHLKNNVCKEMFFKILQVVMLMADIDYKVKSFHHIPADSMFPVFVTSVKMLMKCHKLSKKLIEWFNCEGRDAVFF